MANLYKVTKGEHKGAIGYMNPIGNSKKCTIFNDEIGMGDVTVNRADVKPAGKEGQKLVIDQQVIRKINEIKDLLNKKKRIDQPKPTDEEIKKLLGCIEIEE